MAETFLKIERPGWKRDVLAALALSAVLVIFRWRVLGFFSTHFMGGTESDAGLYVWLLQSGINDILSRPWFTTSAFYPYGESLAWSDNFLLPSALAFPFLKAGVPLSVVWNSIFLSVSFLAGFFCYRLVFNLFGNFPASLISGLIFLTNPLASAYAGHPQLQFTLFFPLTAIIVFRFLESPSFFRAFLLSLAGGCAFLCSVYYAVFAALLSVLLIFTAVLLRPSRLKMHDYLVLLGGASLGVLPFIPFALPYFDVAQAFGQRALHEAYYFSATLSSFFSASEWSAFYKATSSLSHDEGHLFAGMTVYLLSAAAVARLFQARPLRSVYLSILLAVLLVMVCSIPTFRFEGVEYVRSVALWFLVSSCCMLAYFTGRLEEKLDVHYFTRRDLTACFALTACFVFALSLGPLGFPEAGDASITPYAFFHALFPGFNSIRAIARIGILFQFALVVLAGGVLANISAIPKPAAKAVPFLALFALIENNVQTYPLEPLPAKPAIFGEISSLPEKNSALMILPMTSTLKQGKFVERWSDFARINVRYMLWTSDSGLNLVNGYSGVRSKIMKEFPARMKSFPDGLSLESLKEIAGLRYIIYMSKLVPGFNEPLFKAVYENTKELKLLKKDMEGNYLFELNYPYRLNEYFWLLSPSYNQVLPVTLMASQGEGPVKIDLFEFGKVLAIGQVSLPADGRWQQYEINLPAQSNTVVPRALRFSIDGRKEVFLR